MEKLAEELLVMTQKMASCMNEDDAEKLLPLLEARQAIMDQADQWLSEEPDRRFDGRATEMLSKAKGLDNEIMKKLLERKTEMGELLLQARKKKQATMSYFPSYQSGAGAFLDTNK